MSLIVLLLYFVLIGYSNVEGTNDGGCSITDIYESNWISVLVLYINDNQRNQKIFTSTYDGNLEITDCHSTYFQGATNETHFTIETNENFDNFDSNTQKNTTALTISFDCKMTCDGESTLAIVTSVSDYNNHDPDFTSLDGEYKVASPLMPQTDFSVYGATIVVEDIDFTNQDVTFTVEPDDFDVWTVSSASSKEYTAVFRAKAILQIDQPREYTITATDSGTDPGVRSTTKTITLTANSSSSFDVPTFQTTSSSYSYSFTYAASGETCSLVPKDGDITVRTNKPDKISDSLALSGDLKDHFEAVFHTDTKTISLDCISLVSSSSVVSVLFLSLKTDSMASVPIVLYLEEADEASPKFGSPLYTADYGDNNEVTLTEDIEVSPSTAEVSIQGSTGETDFTKYFSLEKVSTKYTVKVSTPLPKEILQSQRIVILTISAKLGALTGYSVVVINLPEAAQSISVQFSQVLYSAVYQVVAEKVTFTADPISVVTEVEDENIRVMISDDSTYRTYFDVSYTNKVVTVSNKINLPTNVLEKISVIPLTLEAVASETKTDSSASASAVLNIQIEYETTGDTRHVNFNRLLYNGTYSSKNDTLKITNEIIIDTDQTDDNIEVSINNDYNEYFSATYSGKKVTIDLIKAVSSTTLQSLTFIPLTLLGRIKSTEHTTQAILNLKIIGDEENNGKLSLSSLIYNGKYTVEDNKANIEYDKIVVETDQEDDKIVVEITNGYDKDFEATYSKKQVSVTLINNSPSATLLQLANIPVGIKLQVEGTSLEAQAVLNLRVIDGENNGKLSLSSLIYNGKYTVEDNKANIEYDKIVVETDQEDDKIVVEITNGYDKDFEATYSKKEVSVTLINNSPSATLLQLANIPVGIKLQVEGTSLEAQAVLNLRVIDGENNGKLSLSSLIYNGKYTVEDNKANIEYDKIVVETDQEDDKIVVEITNGYDKDFEATYSKKEVSVTLINNSPSEALLQLANIPVGIKLQVEGTSLEAQAVLNLRVIDEENNGKLSLSSLIYNGKYTVEDNKANIEYDKIMVETDQEDDKIVVEITNGYDKDFGATYSKKEVSVTLIQDSPSATLLQLANIPVGIKLQVEGTSLEAQAVLNLRVIDSSDSNKNETKTLSFSNVLYSGVYSMNEGDSGGHFTTVEIQLRTNLMDNEVKVTLSNEYGYDKYFDVSMQNRIVSIKTDIIPEKIAKNNKFIPLTVAAEIIATGDISYAVLNVEIDYHGEDVQGSDKQNLTGYIVSIVVLAIILLILIGGFLGLYFWKFKGKHENITAAPKVTFQPVSPKQSFNEKRKGSTSALETRRPTGYVFRKFDEDGSEITKDSTKDPPRSAASEIEKGPEAEPTSFGQTAERRKSVAFDDHIEKLQIDAIEDEDIDKALDELNESRDGIGNASDDSKKSV